MRTYEDPVVTKRPSPGSPDTTVETHPAYAQIGVSRVSGSANLYGSDFTHHHYITIRIKRSELHRDLAHDWHHSRGQYIEVALSESQWATMVSSLNAGDGVPCMLTALGGESIPQIPERPKRVQQFANEVRQRLDRGIASLRKLTARIGDMKLSQKAQKELTDHVGQTIMELESNVPYVAQCFDEHMERTTDAARVEINAHLNAVVTRAGLDVLKSGTPFTLNAGTDDDNR